MTQSWIHAYFLHYIKYMPENFSPLTGVRLFADNTIVYLSVTSAQDAALLQEDLNKLGKWDIKGKWSFSHRSVKS